MSIEHADCFDIYGTNNGLLLNGVYASASFGFGGGLSADPDGVSTQRVVRFASSETGLRYSLQTPSAVVGCARRAWLPSLPSDAGAQPWLARWADIDNTTIATLEVQSTGAIELVVAGDTSYSTNVPVITANAWWHIEDKIDLTNGTYELRMEGKPVLELTGLTFNRATVYQIAHATEVSGIGAFTTWFLKDYVLWNGGGSQNNDFLGAVRVLNLIPTSDVSLGGWVPSTGTTGYDILDNNPPDDGIYLSADDSPPAAMSFELSDLPPDITSVRGLVTYVRASKVDGGDGQLQVSLISGANEDNGADRPITVAQTYWRDISELNPTTASAWTPSEVDAAKLKIDRTL